MKARIKKTVYWILVILGTIYLIWICYLCPEARAEQYDTTIQRDSGSGNHHHHVDIPKRQDPLGLGIDVIREFDKSVFFIDAVKLEVRDDMVNNEWAGYLVAVIKLNKAR